MCLPSTLREFRRRRSYWGTSCAKSSKRSLQMTGIFLDRDGVIIRKAPEGEYITQWAEVEFLPGSIEAIVCLHKFGFKVIIVTNQRGVATGKIPVAILKKIHDKIKPLFPHHACLVSH